jgi:histidine ammonia-lyase
MAHEFLIDGRNHTIQEISAAIKPSTKLIILSRIFEKLIQSRKIVDTFTNGPEPVYGLNTGLGGNLKHRLAPEAIPEFQRQILAGRSVGAGDPATETISRTMLLCRIIGMCNAVSGISLSTFEMMVTLFNKNMSPVIPMTGSIGAGDLIIGAHFGGCLVGEGQLWLNGEKLPAKEALRQAELKPIILQAKDALALCNHSAFSTALGVTALIECHRLYTLSKGVSLVSGEGYGINPTIFDDEINRLRPAAGQVNAAAWFRRGLQRSSLYQPDSKRSIQDAISFRVIASLYGTAENALRHATQEIEIELNASSDNPAVLPGAASMLSTPNFHTPAIALAFDTLAIATVHLATAAMQRVVKLMAPQLSGLDRYLSPIGGASAGFVPMQKTAAALLAEIRLQASPASLDAMPVSDMVEDIAPQTPLTIKKLSTQLESFEWLISLEALVGSQAITLRQPKQLGFAANQIYTAIRTEVPPLHEDRSSAPDLATIREVLRTQSITDELISI